MLVARRVTIDCTSMVQTRRHRDMTMVSILGTEHDHLRVVLQGYHLPCGEIEIGVKVCGHELIDAYARRVRTMRCQGHGTYKYIYICADVPTERQRDKDKYTYSRVHNEKEYGHLCALH